MGLGPGVANVVRMRNIWLVVGIKPQEARGLVGDRALIAVLTRLEVLQLALLELVKD